MRPLVAVLGAVLIALMLGEFFVTFLLPRRVKRDPRIARQIYALAWRPWRLVAGRLSPAASDTMLGFFGPFGLLGELSLWTLGLVVGFAALQWGTGSHLAGGHAASFPDDLFFSAASFFSASTNLTPHGAVARTVAIGEAAAGFGVLFIVIGYLPALYQAFSRRETAVSQLDPRAGSPPSAGALLRRSAERGRWDDLESYLKDWETWTAELMETHLSYPVLAYFRSQHVNQNWLSALTTIVDACAVLVAAAPKASAETAELTFALGRHALADLTHSFRAEPRPPRPNRLGPDDLAELRGLVAQSGHELVDEETMRARLDRLRAMYEPYANALAGALALTLPAWMPDDGAKPNWRRSASRDGARHALP